MFLVVIVDVKCVIWSRSAYLLYYFDIHQIMQLESPNLPQSEVNKRISEGWKRLSVSERSYYLEKAKMEKDGVESVRCIHTLLHESISVISVKIE